MHSIRAKSTKATATAFTKTVTPMSTPMVIGSIVLAMATITRNMVPMSSAVNFCFKVFIFSALFPDGNILYIFDFIIN